MEEGLEPQELFEQAERSHHVSNHEEHEKAEALSKAFTMRSAVTASVLAVGAALASLLSGHAANEAILKTVEASDRWSYYQATSTKSHIFEANKALLASLAQDVNSDATKKSLASFDTKLQKYEKQKEDIQREAQKLEKIAAVEFARHQHFSLSVAALQIGIVLSSVAILTKSRLMFFESILAGVIGIGFVLYGAFGH